MSGLEADTIGGFNAMIEKQKKMDGEAYVTTVLFDTHVQTLHDRLNVKNVKRMTGREYSPCGCTALLDAIGSTIRHIADIHRYAREEDVPEHTVFVITTDGMENASKQYEACDVRRMIEKKKEESGWEFLFLGANIDAVETARKVGIGADFAVNYHSDPIGTRLNYDVVGEALCSIRDGEELEMSWKAPIEEDFASR